MPDPSYRDAARRVAEEFRAYGAGERAATLLESLVHAGAPVD